jgi:hypothetical protein
VVISSNCPIRAPSALSSVTIMRMAVTSTASPVAPEALACVCGEPLADDVNDRGVVTVEGLAIAFRRRTDYVMCCMCLVFYRVGDLRIGRVRPLTLMEIKFLNEIESAEERDAVAAL